MKQKVSIDLKTGCWIWLGRLDPYGFPLDSFKGRVFRVRSKNFEQSKGYAPKRVVSSCNNKLCVNPEHLRDGTQDTERLLYIEKALSCSEIEPAVRAELEAQKKLILENRKAR